MVYPNSCPLSRWCHPTILFSVVPFSSCLQSFLSSGSFPMSQLFTSGGQSIGDYASASVPPKDNQDSFLSELNSLISLQSKGLSESFPMLLLLLSHFSRVRLFVTLWSAARRASLSITNSELAQTHVHWVGNAIQPSHPLSSPSTPALNLSQHQELFQWVGSLHQMAKVLDFSFSISPSNKYSGLISFRIDWFDLLAVQGTLESLF